MATSRSIRPPDDPEILAVPGDLSQRGVGGHLANISSSLVEYANSQVPSALAPLTKGGLSAVIKALAIEYAARGIRANAGEIDDVVEAIVYLEQAHFVTVLREVLDRWKSAVDAHEPQRVAAGFTENAIFQGLHPYSVGRQGIADYYASQPLGMASLISHYQVSKLD